MRVMRASFFACIAAILLALPIYVSGFSGASGSCEHAGVNHGIERYPAQE